MSTFALATSQTPAVRQSVASAHGPALGVRKAFSGRQIAQQGLTVSRTSRKFAVRATSTDDTTVDVDAIVKDLQDKWDRVENKTTVAVYAGGAVVALWLSSTIVGAVNSVPLVPKFLELVGLGYTSWFVYRYLLFKSSREELLEDVEELKRKISGSVQETTGSSGPKV